MPINVAGMNDGYGADGRRARLRERQALGTGLRLRRIQRLDDASRVVQVPDFMEDTMDLREPENREQRAELPSACSTLCWDCARHHSLSVASHRARAK